MNKYTKAMEFDDVKHEYKVNGVVLPSVTEICGPATFTKYRVDNAVIEQAAYRGTMIHELTALWDRGDLEEDSVMASDVALYLMAWIRFCNDYKPQWQYIELPLACRTYAGTIDRIGVIDNKLTIVDIKTTSSMDRANKISLACQLSGYWWLCKQNDIDVDIYSPFGVQLKKDGTYAVHEVKKISEKYAFDPEIEYDKLLKLNQLVKGYRSAE